MEDFSLSMACSGAHDSSLVSEAEPARLRNFAAMLGVVSLFLKDTKSTAEPIPFPRAKRHKIGKRQPS